MLELITRTSDLTLASAIEAGVSTIFVGLGEDPYVLATRAPALFDVSNLVPNQTCGPLTHFYQMIVQRYPQVVQGVPRMG